LSEKSSWVSIACVEARAGAREPNLDDGRPARPVPGVALEVVTASAEVRTAYTNQEGVAYLDRIAPGLVSIRVLGRDGSAWRPLEGDAATPCRADERVTWHEVQRGECLSRIAHRYGLKDWRDIWTFRMNEALRKKRKSPHVLHPGDMLAVPAVQLYEIARETEQTHRIEVTPRSLELVLRLADHHGRPFRAQPYELRLTRGWDGAPLTSGTTDDEGVLREEVPASAEQIYVNLPAQRLAWPVTVSTLPGLPERASEAFDEQGQPTQDAVRALQLRLNALGIASGPIDGAWNAPTQLALLKLRQSRGRTGGEPLQDADLRDLASFGV
jgi:N-acetylmuramoyl-L-alanine amidase